MFDALPKHGRVLNAPGGQDPGTPCGVHAAAGVLTTSGGHAAWQPGRDGGEKEEDGVEHRAAPLRERL